MENLINDLKTLKTAIESMAAMAARSIMSMTWFFYFFEKKRQKISGAFSFFLFFTVLTAVFTVSLSAQDAQDQEVASGDQKASSEEKNAKDDRPLLGFEYHGYLRAGASAHTKGGASSGGACFSVPHQKWNGAYFRLGNDCLDYGEFSLAGNIAGKGDNSLKVISTFDYISDQRNSVSRVDWFPPRSSGLCGRLWSSLGRYHSMGW